MEQVFQRIAIVNRGEAAMRFIHAVREFNQEHGTELRTIALFTDAERNAMFVREADEAVALGQPRVVDPNTNDFKSCYVDYATIERALKTAQADAVWVGWGFVSEHAQFADLCRELGIVFMGPDADVMRLVGDRISSKRLAEKANVPIAAWSGSAADTLDDASHHAERLGYPLFFKAAAARGQQGMRRVENADELPHAFAAARSEAFQGYGDPTVYMEQLVNGARHIEVQIIADHHGNVWAAGVCDCSIQRDQQKVVEESPSPVLPPHVDAAIRDAAVRLARAANYQSAGSVEFSYSPEQESFVFLEMNTSLSMEHAVMECTTGIDLVKLQIHVALGGTLQGEPPRTTGHAIQVQLTAEDAENRFTASPGVVERFRILTGPGVRMDRAVSEGDTIPAEFDTLIAKIIAHGRTREEALARLRRALEESIVVVKGGCSNRAFLLELLGRPEVRNAEADVCWLDRQIADGRHTSRNYAEIALVLAAVESYNRDLKVEQKQFYASAMRGRPQVRDEVGHEAELRYLDHSYKTKTDRLGLKRYSIDIEGTRIDARLDRLGPFEYFLSVYGRRFHIVCVEQGSSYLIELNGSQHRVERDDGGVVRAPSPSVVVSVNVKPGDVVSAGDRLAVLEAMKMEMPVLAPCSGKVRTVTAIPNVQVGPGAQLLQIEPSIDRSVSHPTTRLHFASSPSPESTKAPLSRILAELRQLLLGFDVDSDRTARLISEWSRLPETQTDEAVRFEEDGILNIFVDISSLFRRNPKLDEEIAGETPSFETHLFSFLRTFDTRKDEVPSAFVEALRRAVAHYGVTSLDRSPELEESMLWICKSHQRLEQQVAPVMRVLQRRLTQVPTCAGEPSRWLLERLISITRGVYPSISDAARELRYKCFDEPLFDRARKQIYASAASDIDYLASNPQAADRHQRVRALVECPQPLASVVASRFASAQPELQQLMLEVMVSRYYRVRALSAIRPLPVEGYCCVTSQYTDAGKRVHIFAVHADYAQLSDAMQSLLAFTLEVPAEDDIVLDFFTWNPSGLAAPEATEAKIRSVIESVRFDRKMRRIVVAVSGPGREPGLSEQHFTYEPSEQGYREVELFRGVHPMMAERLHLWRLQNFNITRLPSVEDIYLLHAVANENPKDERLFAVAEVRDLTPIRDDAGRIVELPHLERMFSEAAAAIRSFQAKRSPRSRLYWNRIFLYVWPTLELTPDELNDIVHKLAPTVDDLGLEQIVVRVQIPNPKTGELRDTVIRISSPGDAGLLMTFRPASRLQPMKALTAYDQKVVKMRQRGLLYPYEIIRMLTPPPENTHAEYPPGEFIEHDLDACGRLAPVDRPHGLNKANIIVGVIRNLTPRYPEGMTRVLLLGDPSKDLGAIAEPECRRILGALELATKMKVPLEWFPISAGAKISMESGVENMDWIARVLRGLIEFTQAGGEVNLVVNGINVGAQPYWNAEATMLMHTRGILIMTPKAAMVLTGKRALDFSGSVSAEDNHGIGGYDRIMGFNGQAQYFARDIDDACHILMRHYDHTYVAPGERFPRRAETNDPVDRDVRLYPHGGTPPDSFAVVGEIFSDETNPGRKRSFDIRRVMMAVSDQDHPPLERWSGMRSAETAVVWDAHLGGYPVCLIGIESKPTPRFGVVPADGPDQWTGGTLFPLSSKKIARSLNSASNNRPAVILANLSGFDGSPESMRQLQLEYGAEIGRAVVNFKGPMVFCVISRYHGGAYVVFSSALNEQLEVVALEGTFASVIGGAPAAAVVFASEVEARARKDERIVKLTEALAVAQGAEKARLQSELDSLFELVRSERLGDVAGEFDQIHSVHRALKVGALSEILPPKDLRPFVIHALERGIAKQLQHDSAAPVAAREEAEEALASAATTI